MTELSEKDAADILQRLISRTEQGSLTWEVWADGIYEYFAVSPRFRYYAKTRDNDGTAPYALQIYRLPAAPTSPVYVEEASDPPPTEELQSYPPSVYSESVERLYRLARARALGVENLRSDILEDLGDD